MEYTGRRVFKNLRQVYVHNGLPTGTADKPNVPGDPDYIPPQVDTASCPTGGGGSGGGTTTAQPCFDIIGATYSRLAGGILVQVAGAICDLEFSLDGENWQVSNVLPVSDGRFYTVYVRETCLGRGACYKTKSIIVLEEKLETLKFLGESSEYWRVRGFISNVTEAQANYSITWEFSEIGGSSFFNEATHQNSKYSEWFDYFSLDAGKNYSVRLVGCSEDFVYFNPDITYPINT